MEEAEILRKVLRSALDDGSLRMWRGRISRPDALRVAGLATKSTLGKNPRIDAVFAEFDEIAARAGVLSVSGTVDDLRAVKRAVSGDDCLTPDRRSINVSAVARATGIALYRLSKAPMRALIEAGTARAREAARADEFQVHMDGGHSYDFAPLLAHWPRNFAVGVARAFDPSGRGHTRNRTVRCAILALLGWIAASEAPDCRAVVEGSRAYSIPDKDWRSATGAYRMHIGPAQAKLRDFWIVQDLLCGAGLVPALPRERVPVGDRRPGSKRPSLAEVAPPASGPAGGDAGYARFVEDLLSKRAVSPGTGEDEGASAFLASVGPGVVGTGAKTPAEIGAVILSTLGERLGLIADAAWARVERATAALELGRALLEQATIDVRSVVDAFVAAPREERVALLERAFPACPRLRAADALRLRASTRFGPDHHTALAILDGLRDAGTEWPWGEGGPDELLEPTLDAVCSVLTCYLEASGANVAVGLDLHVDCMRNSDVPGDVVVDGFKSRAGNKAIIAHMARSSRAATALAWLAEAGRSMRSDASPHHRDRLMVARWRAAAVPLSKHRFNCWFDALIAAIPAFAGMDVRASSIRPTILLRAALENDGRLRAGVAMGQHDERTSQGYQQRWPVRARYDAHIARFQAMFEILATGGETALLAGLGVGERERPGRFEDLRSSGLGTLCAAPMPGAEPGRGCATLSCWDECPHVTIVAEPGHIALLQIWRDALRAARPEWERDRPERWGRYWLPWMILVDVVQERMSRGPLRQAWKEAELVRASIEARPGFEPPRPF